MFIVDQLKYWVTTKPENVVYLASSVNKPVVVLPGKSAQPAQAYVAIIRAAAGYEIYVFLHCMLSNEGLLYKWDGGAVAKESAGVVQKEAVGFTESMGFMTSDLRWRDHTPEGRQDVFNSIPMFFQDLSPFKQEVEEEVLEIEPVQEEELVVEAVEEEPAETVTEGDFNLHEEAFAEPGQEQPDQGMPLGELPDLDPGVAQQVEAAPQDVGMTEEDLLLESLEAKEEPPVVQAQAPVQKQPVAPPQPPAPEVPQAVEAEEVEITIGEEPAPAAEPQAQAPEPQPEPAQAAVEPVDDAEEIIIGGENVPVAEPVQTEAAPAEPEAVQVEEETIEMPVAEPEVVQIEEETIEMPAMSQPKQPAPMSAARANPAPATVEIVEEPAAEVVPEQATPAAEPEPAMEPVAEAVAEPVAAVPEEQPVVDSADLESGTDDLSTAVRFLIMF